jgi:hypothetical protein
MEGRERGDEEAGGARGEMTRPEREGKRGRPRDEKASDAGGREKRGERRRS